MILQLFHAARGSMTARPCTTSMRWGETRVDNSPHDTRTEFVLASCVYVRLHRFRAGRALAYTRGRMYANARTYYKEK